MKNIVIIFIALITGLSVWILIPQSDSPIVLGESVKFELVPQSEIKLLGRFSDIEVTHEEALKRSPSLDELVEKKLEVIALSLKEAGIDEKALIKVNTIAPLKKPKSILRYPNLSFQIQPGVSHLVEVEGRIFDLGALSINLVKYNEIQSQILRNQIKTFEGIVIDKALKKMAEKKNTSKSQFINDVIQPKSDVSRDEIDQFAADHNLHHTDDSTKNRLQVILSNNKRDKNIRSYVGQKFRGTLGQLYLETPAVRQINQPSGLDWGSSDGAVDMLVFTDLSCGPCKHLIKNLTALKGEKGDNLRIGMFHFFSQSNRYSRMVAEASHCLYEQDRELAWKFQKTFVEGRYPASEKAIQEVVGKVGAKEQGFKNCFLQRRYRERVKQQMKVASQMGVVSQPTVVLKSSVLTGVISLQDLKLGLELQQNQRGLASLKTKARELLGIE